MYINEGTLIGAIIIYLFFFAMFVCCVIALWRMGKGHKQIAATFTKIAELKERELTQKQTASKEE